MKLVCSKSNLLSGVQIGNDETIRYRCLVNKVDSPEFKEEGERKEEEGED